MSAILDYETKNSTDATRGQRLAARVLARKDELEDALADLCPRDVLMRQAIETALATIYSLMTGDIAHPSDVVARALNRMRERITALIDDRTKMLAAISHDLRTPITRMRLRAEFIEDESYRGRMLDDLDQMRGMLESVLSFLRDGRRLGPMTLTDIASTLQLIADQFADIGRKVAYDGPAHAMATVRPDDLQRAVTNLVENAARFGAEAVIRLHVATDQFTIDVEDDGPGISDARKQNMLEPFVRGDEARNMDEAAGFGLGLSITQEIVEAHAGRIWAENRLGEDGATVLGARFRVTLPAIRKRSSGSLG